MCGGSLQKPAFCRRIITCQNQPSTRPDHHRKLVKKGGLQNAPRRMAFFRPWIGKHDKGTSKACRPKTRHDQPNIIWPDADIAKLLFINMAKQTGNTIDERFGADEIAIRHRRGKASQMLTTAKTDFKIAIGLVAKLIINRPRRIKGKLRQSFIKKPLHRGTKRAAFAPTIKTRPQRHPVN